MHKLFLNLFFLSPCLISINSLYGLEAYCKHHFTLFVIFVNSQGAPSIQHGKLIHMLTYHKWKMISFGGCLQTFMQNILPVISELAQKKIPCRSMQAIWHMPRPTNFSVGCHVKNYIHVNMCHIPVQTKQNLLVITHGKRMPVANIFKG